MLYVDNLRYERIFNSARVNEIRRWGIALFAMLVLFSSSCASAVAQNKSPDPQANTENRPPNYEYDPDQAFNPLLVTYRAPNNSTAISTCPGEHLIFTVEAEDTYDKERPVGSSTWTAIPGVGPYQIKLYTSAGGSFDSPSGPTYKLISGLNAENVNLYISNTWNGTAISVTTLIQDLAPNPVPSPDIGTTKDSDLALYWTINKRSTAPISMKQVFPTTFNQWIPDTALYYYQMTPVPPHYQGQTVLESFGATSAVFSMTDLDPIWRASHPTLTTPNQVCQYLFSSGSNGTFVIDANDEIKDQHGGFGPTDAFTATALSNGIGYTLPQTYSACTNSLGSYIIERHWQNGNITIRKTGP